MKIVDTLKQVMLYEIFTNEEIDNIMEQHKYLPDEIDEECEEGILKYTNGRSQIWLKYIREREQYLISDITMKTKRKGKTKVRAFRTEAEILGMMNYFRDNKKYDEFLIFVLGILLARRVGDTLSLKWSDFYYENGERKDSLNTLIEDKTDKIIDISITQNTWNYIDEYCRYKNFNPLEHIKEDIFLSSYKNNLPNNYTEEEYKRAIDKQAACFRYEFKKAAEYNGIKGVSCHSMRKTFGRLAHEINRFDPDCLPALQTVFGHENLETTKIYIDIMDEKAKKMFNDVGTFISDIDNGKSPVIDNVPVIAIKTNDLRDILLKAYDKGRTNSNVPDVDVHMTAINQLLSTVEQMRL